MVLGIMNSLGYAFNAWLPLLTYPALDGPRFKKGFIYSTCAYTAQFGITGLVFLLQRREKRQKLEKEELSESQVQTLEA